MNRNGIDPYSPKRGYYECVACGYRETSEKRLPACPECGSDVRNLAVPRGE
ncbi:MAG: rubrerythrin-like domain-containing protein [Haloplanus sp.]